MSRVTTQIMDEVKKIICGKDKVILMTLTGILAGGHVLIEDVPGVGKTSMALAFSKAMGLDYGRVQFTPDILPSDITGFSVYDKNTDTMRYQQGAVFHNLFLADELNRASSRTQSALLEAMEEGQVTVDGNTYELPKPFIVFATQNPFDASGTSMIPDSQLDRFSIRVSMGYPSNIEERIMIKSRKGGRNPMDDIEKICDKNKLVEIQEEVSNMFVTDDIVNYIVDLVSKTRDHVDLLRGASPRASLILTSMTRSYAYLANRNYVIPSDVQSVFPAVMCHRIRLTQEAEVNKKTTLEVVNDILETVPAPKI